MSDEKLIDDAIELANKYAQKSYDEERISPARDDVDSYDEEPSRIKSVFSFKKNKSPKEERKNYTEEIANVKDINEDLSPEAEEAYNMLVVKGSVKEKSQQQQQQQQDIERPRSIRERRLQRSQEHQRTSQSDLDQAPHTDSQENIESTASSASVQSNVRSLRDFRDGSSALEPTNLRNIRNPQGIPTASKRASRQAEDEVDSNPLRRLRNSQAIISRPGARRPVIPLDRSAGAEADSIAKRPVRTSVDLTNGHNRSETRKTHVTNPSIPLGTKLKTFDQEDGGGDAQVGITEPFVRSRENGDHAEEEEDVNPIPLPPRQPLQPGTLNKAPRQRKHPLLLLDNNNKPQSPTYENGQPLSHPQPSPTPSDEEPVHDISNDSVFSSTCDCPSTEEPPLPAPRRRFPLAKVSCSAEQMGCFSASDPFWLQRLSLLDDQLATATSDSDMVVASEDIVPPMTAKYKSSDISGSVSYEDLLDFALDGAAACGR